MAGTPSGLLRHVRRLVGDTTDYLTDWQLLQRFVAAGDQAAFALLVRRHGPMVLGVCRRLLGHEQDAEDVFQAAFVILARRAGAVRRADAGGFLYRVAHHLATRARAGAARRRQHERRAEVAAPADAERDVTWREMQGVVGEELQRLPGEARSALVLCYLEGRTHEEAARQLGWSKGTLRRRLDRGRELLRRRLLARGLAPLAALTATLFAEETTASAVSPLLIGATLRAATNSSAASPAVAALVDAGSAVVPAGTARFATAAVLAMSLLMGAGLWACLGQPENPAGKAAQRTPRADAKADDEKVVVVGQVLGPDDKPFAGARLYLPRRSKGRPQGPADGTLVHRGTSGADGRFLLELPREEVQSDRPVPLLAAADGFGLAWVEWTGKAERGGLKLRLVKDVPIRGRLVTTEGKPAAGVTVTLVGLLAIERMDDFLRLYQREPRHVDEGTGATSLTVPLNDVLGVKPSDKDGRFEVRGVGAERVAGIELKGDAVAPARILVLTRVDFNARAYAKDAIGDAKERLPLFGPSFEHALLRAADATSAVEGVVREAGTGKPVAGATVRARGVSAVTDAQGRYRLSGLPKENGEYGLSVSAPDNTPLIGYWTRIATGAGRNPVRADAELRRGTVVTGLVYDKSTGKGVAACSVRFAPLPENKAGPTKGLALYGQADGDGRFRLVVIPGPGVLLAGAPGTCLKIDGVPVYPFKPAEFDAADRPRVKMTGLPKRNRNFLTLDGPEALDFSNACKVLDVRDDGTAVTCDLALDPGRTLTVNLQDPEGKPLAGAVVAGISPQALRTVPFKTAAVRIYALDPDKPRPVVFLHAERKLAAVVTLRGDEKDPVTVRLAPTAVVTARVLDEDGGPVAGVEVYTLYSSPAGKQLTKSQDRNPLPRTDKEGRFRLEGVVPGLSMGLGFRKGRHGLMPEKQTEVTAPESGKTLDLGDVRTTSRAPGIAYVSYDYTR
jgi:RNA polymerase sigma factor (sigma-70 family)